MHLAGGRGPGLALEDLAHGDGAGLLVGHLDADDTLAGDGRLDADAGGLEGHLEIAGHAGNALDADTGGGQELETGDNGTLDDISDLDVDVELGEGLDDDLAPMLGIAVDAVPVGTGESRAVVGSS